MPAKLPNLYTGIYTTSDRRTRTLWYVQFKDWKGIRRTFPAGDSLLYAKQRRDQLLGQNVIRYDFDKEKRNEQQRGSTFHPRADRWLALKKHKRSQDKNTVFIARFKEFFGNVRLGQVTAARIKAGTRHRILSPYQACNTA